MKESRLEQEKCKNRGKTGVCKILQPLRNRHFAAKQFCSPNKFVAESPLPCGIAILLRNHFVASGPSLRKFLQLRSTFLAHECHFAAQFPSFRSCKMAAKPPHLEILHFAAETPFRRVFHSSKTTLWHTSATSQRHTPISQL